MKTKIFTLMLTLVMVLGTLTAPALAAAKKTDFSDVPAGHWAEEAVAAVSAGGLMSGYGGGRFGTDDAVNVDQLMMVLSRAKGLETAAKDNYWAFQAVENALNNNWGFRKDTILPFVYGVPCSRQEAFTAMVRAFGDRLKETASVSQSDIPDFNKIESAREADILKAYRTGLTAGIDGTKAFDPNGTLTRAQLATILYRLGVTKAVAYTPVNTGADACAACGSTSDTAHYAAHGKDVVLCAAHYADLKKASQLAMSPMKEMGEYYDHYGLADVTGDGIPEIFSDEGIMVYQWMHGGVKFNMLYESMVIQEIYYDSAKQQFLVFMDGRDYTIGMMEYTLYGWSGKEFDEVEYGRSENDAPDAAAEARFEQLRSQMTPMTYDYEISESPDAILLDMIASLK